MRGWRAPEHVARHPRRSVLVVVVLLATVLTGGLIAGVLAFASGIAERSAVLDSPRITAVPDPMRPPMDSESEELRDRSAVLPVVPRGEPIRVRIPAIEVDVPLVRLGMRPDRSMEVPDFGLAGWYVKGPMPGHPGPSVLAGHVDSYAGPDVFHRLHELVADDEVQVFFDSGDQVAFLVTRIERTPKDALPTGSIWPRTNDRILALITCGGTFDRSARSYEDNVIVYAELHPGPTIEAASGFTGLW